MKAEAQFLMVSLAQLVETNDVLVALAALDAMMTSVDERHRVPQAVAGEMSAGKA